MKEIEIDIIFYGYELPIIIMFVWRIWRLYTDPKKIRTEFRNMSHTIKHFLILFIPGVSLFGVLMLLILFVLDSFDMFNDYINNYREKQTKN